LPSGCCIGSVGIMGVSELNEALILSM